MPGPMSTPNGVASTTAQRDLNKRIVTGKTQVKRGTIPKHRTGERKFQQSRAAQRAQEEH